MLIVKKTKTASKKNSFLQVFFDGVFVFLRLIGYFWIDLTTFFCPSTAASLLFLLLIALFQKIIVHHLNKDLGSYTSLTRNQKRETYCSKQRHMEYCCARY